MSPGLRSASDDYPGTPRSYCKRGTGGPPVSQGTAKGKRCARPRLHLTAKLAVPPCQRGTGGPPVSQGTAKGRRSARPHLNFTAKLAVPPWVPESCAPDRPPSPPICDPCQGRIAMALSIPGCSAALRPRPRVHGCNPSGIMLKEGT